MLSGSPISAVLKRFLVLAISFCAVVAVIAVIHYKTDQRLERMALEADEAHNVVLAHEVLTRELRSVGSDLTFLTKLNELRELLDKPADERTRLLLAQEFLYFSEKKKRYDQIRLLDQTGMEIIRVNYEEGYPRVLAKDELHDKSNRYYVQRATDLDVGEVYISPFDLSVEDGRIKEPIKPVVRFATLLFNPQGQKKGILVLNLMGDKLIRSFQQAAIDISDHLHLTNASGFWLSSPRAVDEWGFVLGHQRSLSDSYPRAWQSILEQDAGQLDYGTGLYTFTTVYPADLTSQQRGAGDSRHGVITANGAAAQAHFWKIISRVSPSVLSDVGQEFFRKHLPLYTAAASLLLTLSFILAQAGARRYAAQVQKEYVQRFRENVETMKFAAVTLDPYGRITFCNNFLLALSGWSREDVTDHDWFERFLPQAERSEARAAFEEMMVRNAPPKGVETAIKTRRGETRLFSWNITLSRDHAGQATGLTGIGEDITEKRRTEEQLRKLSRAVEQSPNPVIITDADGLIEYVNPKFAQITGYSAEEAIGQTPRLLKSGESSEERYRKLWETIKSGEEWRGVFHNRKKNGELYWEYTAISPIRDARNQITHFLAVKEDVTERRELIQQVEERKRELEQAKTLAVMGRMASMIAHDLRNPLSSIKMTLQILGKRPNATRREEIDELSGIALEQVRYMEQILADLLQFSRPDALKPEWLSVNKLLDSAVFINQKAIHDHAAKVSTHYEPQLPTIHGDPTKLRQVFSNLIMNALEATEDSGRTPDVKIYARVDLRDSSPHIRVEIRDNGDGIDASQFEKFFEPFFTTRAKGTGLGLSIVKRVVEQHGGAIRLIGSESGGTVAVVVLPTAAIAQ